MNGRRWRPESRRVARRVGPPLGVAGRGRQGPQRFGRGFDVGNPSIMELPTALEKRLRLEEPKIKDGSVSNLGFSPSGVKASASCGPAARFWHPHFQGVAGAERLSEAPGSKPRRHASISGKAGASLRVTRQEVLREIATIGFARLRPGTGQRCALDDSSLLMLGFAFRVVLPPQPP